MLYVYVITDRAGVPEGRGMLGAPLETVGNEPPFAIVSEHDGEGIGPSEQDLWAHEQVVERLMESGTVLPLRFGTTVADAEELVGVLHSRSHEFMAALNGVRGAVELAVRAELQPENATPEAALAGATAGAAGPGTAYMLERLEAERRSAATSDRIHGELAELARRSSRRARGVGSGSFNVAYLVDRDRVEEFRSRVEALGAEIEGAAIVCTGPWPPYSFTSDEEE